MRTLAVLLAGAVVVAAEGPGSVCDERYDCEVRAAGGWRRGNLAALPLPPAALLGACRSTHTSGRTGSTTSGTSPPSAVSGGTRWRPRTARTLSTVRLPVSARGVLVCTRAGAALPRSVRRLQAGLLPPGLRRLPAHWPRGAVLRGRACVREPAGAWRPRWRWPSAPPAARRRRPQECENILTGDPECCTADCEILGYGPPIFALQDDSNPVSGGLTIQHIAAPPTYADRFECPPDAKTGQPSSRSITYLLDCDPNAPIFSPNVVRAEEVTPCVYEIQIKTRYACGCAPDCEGKSCGSDGCNGFCGSPGGGGVCPTGQTCDANFVCRDPTPHHSSSAAPTYTGGDVAGAVFGGALMGIVVFLLSYFAYTRGYCTAAYAAATGGNRGFKRAGTAGATPATAAPSTGTTAGASGATYGAGATSSAL